MVTLALNVLMGLLGIAAIRSWRQSGTGRRSIRRRLGFGRHRPLTEIALGALIGAFAIIAVYLAERVGGHAVLGDFAPRALVRLDLWLMLAAGALGEEFVFRGLGLNGLIHFTRRPWLAVAASALAFGLAHAAAPHATALSVASTALGGVMYAVAFLRTGRLWAPMSLHLSWNAMQALVFGYPMSGRSFENALNVAVDGPAWWTGGAYGPEGGVLGLIARLLVIVGLVATLRPSHGKAWFDALEDSEDGAPAAGGSAA